MAGRFSFLILFCALLAVAVSSSSSSSSNDGQWVDDITGNAQVMGTQSDDVTQQVFVPVAPVAVVHSDGDGHDHHRDGSWLDDVTGNLVVMGEDPLSQDPGLNS